MDKPKYQPAFPLTSHWHNELNHYNGMALRDYMAAKAIEGASVLAIGSIRYNHDLLAADAYALADAMLKARDE